MTEKAWTILGRTMLVGILVGGSIAFVACGDDCDKPNLTPQEQQDCSNSSDNSGGFGYGSMGAVGAGTSSPRNDNLYPSYGHVAGVSEGVNMGGTPGARGGGYIDGSAISAP